MENYNNFNNEMMIGHGKTFAERLAQVNKEVPIQWAFFSWLTCLGSLLDGKVVFDNLQIRPNMFSILLGPSSSRKSTTAGLVQDCFCMIEEFKWVDGIGSAAGLLRVLSDNPSFLFHQDEMRSFFSKASRQGSNLLSSVNSLFERAEISNYLKSATDSVAVTGAHLSMLGCSTPETYQEAMSESAQNIGLDNRFFIVPGESERIGLPKNTIYDLADWNEARVHGILEMIDSIRDKNRRGEKIIRFAAGVEEAIFEPFYKNAPNLASGENSRRLDTYSLKLALLLTLSQDKTEVDEQAMLKAIDLVKYQAVMREEYNPVLYKNDIAEYEATISKYMKKHQGETVYLSKLKYVNRRQINKSGAQPFMRAINSLIEAEDIQVVGENDGVMKSLKWIG